MSDAFRQSDRSEFKRSDAELADVIADYLDRLNRGGNLDPAVIIAEHPEKGPRIVAALQEFVRLESDDNEPLGTLGDYTLRRRIGQGGTGVVYSAWENSMDRAVALKVLPAGVAADEKAYMRFLRDSKTAGQLSHPDIVPVFLTGVKEQTPFYAMDLESNASHPFSRRSLRHLRLSDSGNPGVRLEASFVVCRHQ